MGRVVDIIIRNVGNKTEQTEDIVLIPVTLLREYNGQSG